MHRLLVSASFYWQTLIQVPAVERESRKKMRSVQTCDAILQGTREKHPQQKSWAGIGGGNKSGLEGREGGAEIHTR